MRIKCGTCGGYHETVSAIRECSGVRVMAGGEVERWLGWQETMAEADRDSRVWLTDVAAGNATIEQYVAARDDLTPEQKADGLAAYNQMAARITERMATPKMVKFVEDILKFKTVPPTVADHIAECAGTGTLTFHDARKFINTYKDAPKRQRKLEDVAREHPGAITFTGDLVDGMYRNPADGSIRKVYHTVHGANEQVTKLLKVLEESERYAKIVRGKEVEVKAEFVYEGKRGLAGLTPDMRMTLEEAKKYGAIYGVCIRCSATLTKEESIERAMGSTCASKANWA